MSFLLCFFFFVRVHAVAQAASNYGGDTFAREKIGASKQTVTRDKEDTQQLHKSAADTKTI